MTVCIRSYIHSVYCFSLFFCIGPSDVTLPVIVYAFRYWTITTVFTLITAFTRVKNSIVLTIGRKLETGVDICSFYH